MSLKRKFQSLSKTNAYEDVGFGVQADNFSLHTEVANEKDTLNKDTATNLIGDDLIDDDLSDSEIEKIFSEFDGLSTVENGEIEDVSEEEQESDEDYESDEEPVSSNEENESDEHVGSKEEDGSDDEWEDVAEDSIEEEPASNLDNFINTARESQHLINKSSKSKKLKVVLKNEADRKDKTSEDKEENEKEEFDEYEEDSSDEEDLRNTVGNVPINWYDQYEHVGYGLDGLPIRKPKKADALEKFLEKVENPDFDCTVFDKQTGQNVILSDAHLDLAQRIVNNKTPNPQHNPYEPFPDLYSHEVLEMPLSGREEHKRSFLPVKSERAKVIRIAHYIRRKILNAKNKKPKKRPSKFYDIWDGPFKRRNRIYKHVPAPRAFLPGHKHSYNPPPEYQMTFTDMKRLQGTYTGDKGSLFQKMETNTFKSVREIPLHSRTFQHRMQRLFELYLAPRKIGQKIVAESKDFLPSFPDREELRPFPTLCSIVFKGHRSIIRTISVHPGGKYLASGSDDQTVRIWELNSGRCLRTFEFSNTIQKVSWNPNPKLFLLGVVEGDRVVFLNPETYLTDKIVVQQTNAIFTEDIDQGRYIVPRRIEEAVKWRKPTEKEWSNGFRLVLDHFKSVKTMSWHCQGDYFASVMPYGSNRSVLVHQLSRSRSHVPFRKPKGRVETAAFHPKKPLLFVLTQSRVRVYDLKRSRLVKKIQANSRWTSCIGLHPSGEHFIIGGYDRRVNWFEMECTKRPHLMRYHRLAVRSVNFHPKYPLFASCSDDGKVIVAHATVYDDWVTDPLIVPVKRLKGHCAFDDYYVLDLAWHPYEPFVLTAGADATIRLWS